MAMVGLDRRCGYRTCLVLLHSIEQLLHLSYNHFLMSLTKGPQFFNRNKKTNPCHKVNLFYFVASRKREPMGLFFVDIFR